MNIIQSGKRLLFVHIGLKSNHVSFIDWLMCRYTEGQTFAPILVFWTYQQRSISR